MAYDLENFFMFLVIYFYLKSIEVQTKIHGHRPGCGNRGHFSTQVHSPNAHSIRGWGARDRSWAFQELSSWLQLSFNEAQFTNDFFFFHVIDYT